MREKFQVPAGTMIVDPGNNQNVSVVLYFQTISQANDFRADCQQALAESAKAADVEGEEARAEDAQ